MHRRFEIRRKIGVDRPPVTYTNQFSQFGNVFARRIQASTDGRNALALGLLQTQNTVAGGAATFQTAYAEMVANNGIKTRELRVMGEAQQVG